MGAVREGGGKQVRKQCRVAKSFCSLMGCLSRGLANVRWVIKGFRGEVPVHFSISP